MSTRLNKYKYPGAKRLMLEAQELKDKTEDYCAQPIDDNLFEWHFTVRGPPDTAFEGGFYHGRLSFPTEYPMKPPSIILLTPNGRFETNKKICLSISGFHPETWQPSWSVRTALLALIAFMPTKGNRAIGSLDYSDPERRKLAKHSRTWRCETCGPIRDLLKQPEDTSNVTNQHKCEAGTSRVSEGGNNSSSETSQDGRGSSSDRSDSEGEIRDSFTDSQSSTSASDSSDTDGTSSNKLDRRGAAATVSSEAGGKSAVMRPKQQQQQQQQRDQVTGQPDEFTSVAATSNGEHTTRTTGRRSYPPMVFISILILLLLLIVRRIVMILQS